MSRSSENPLEPETIEVLKTTLSSTAENLGIILERVAWVMTEMSTTLERQRRKIDEQSAHIVYLEELLAEATPSGQRADSAGGD